MIGSVQQMNRQINDSLDGQRLEMTKERDALKAYVDQLLENLGNLSKAQMSEVQQQLSSALAQTHHWTQQFESTFSEKARNQQLQYLDFLDGMKNTQAEYLANSSHSLDSMISSVGKINQQIGNSLDFHRDEITKEREVLKVSVNEMLQSVGRISQAQIQGVQQQLDSALERTHQWTEHFETSLAQRSQHQQVQHSQFLDEIKKAQFEYLATSNQSMGALINSVQQHTVQVEASMERVIQRVSSQGQSMQELTASVSTAIREFEGLVVKNSVLSAQLQKAADALKLTSQQAEEASRSLGLANRDSALASERLGAALNNSKITFEHMQTVLKDHEALYKTLDEKLEKSVQQISSAIAAYNKVTTDGLNRHLSDFDSSLAAACARLAETVETIESPIDELAEVITKVTTKLSR